MSHTLIDHIAVTAFSLEAGAAFVAQALGVSPQPGGEHPRLATHNLLLRLGQSTYLEVIAPNPAAPAPSRPRWFGLDRLGPQSPPSLSAWVARTPDIQGSLAAASEPLGRIEPMSRGTLQWLITLTEDGSVPLDGVGPALIEWHAPAHPAAQMEDKGLALAGLEIFHPDPGRVTRLLDSLGLQAPVSVLPAEPGAAPSLLAHIQTPQGLRVLSSSLR